MERRRALMQSFVPEELAHHEPMVRRLAREYVDRFIDKGEADLVDEMLWEIPLTVALHFLGVPEEDMDTLREYSIAHTVNTWGRPTRDEQLAVAEAVGQVLAVRRRRARQDARRPAGHGWMQYCHPAPEGAARGRHRLLPALDDDGRHRRRARDHGARLGQRDAAAAAEPRRVGRHLRRSRADPQRGRGVPAAVRVRRRVAADRDGGHADRRRRDPEGREAPDRQRLGQPRRAPLRERRTRSTSTATIPRTT